MASPRLRVKRVRTQTAAQPNLIVSSLGTTFNFQDNAVDDTFVTQLTLAGGIPSGLGTWAIAGGSWAKLALSVAIGDVTDVRIDDSDGLAAGDQGAKSATITYSEGAVELASIDLSITIVDSTPNNPPTTIVSSQGSTLQIPDNAAHLAVVSVLSLAGGAPDGTGTWSLTNTPWSKFALSASTGLTVNLRINDADGLAAGDQGAKTARISYTGEQGMSPITLDIAATVYDNTAGTVVRTLTLVNDSGGTVTDARIEVGLPLGPNKMTNAAARKLVCTLGGGIGDIQANLSQRSKGWSENDHIRWGALNFVVPSLPNGTTTVQVKVVAGTEAAAADGGTRLALLDDLSIDLTNLLRKVLRTAAGTSVAGTWTAAWNAAEAVVRQRRSGASSSAWECCVPFKSGATIHESLVARFIATVWSDDTIHVKALVCNSRADLNFPIVKHNTWGYTANLKYGALALGSHTINGQIAHSHHYIGENGTQGRGFYIRTGATVSDQAAVWVQHDPADLIATQMVPPLALGTGYAWTGEAGVNTNVSAYAAGGASAEGTAYWAKALGPAGVISRDHHFLCPNPIADWILNPSAESKRWKNRVAGMAVAHFPVCATDPVKFGPVYLLNQGLYTKPTGYSTNDYKLLGWSGFAGTHILGSVLNAPATSTTDSFNDQTSPFDQCHWGQHSLWSYMMFGSVWEQCAFEDEVIMCHLAFSYNYKTYTVGATPSKWHQAILTSTQERAFSTAVKTYCLARALNALDSPFYQYYQDLVENYLDAGVDVYNNSGRQSNETRVLFPAEAKVLGCPKRWYQGDTFITTWMASYGTTAACMIRHMGGTTKLTFTDIWITWMVNYAIQGRGYFDSYWVTPVAQTPLSAPITLAMIIQDWDNVKVNGGNSNATSVLQDYNEASWSASLASAASQNVYFRYAFNGQGWVAGINRCGIQMAKVIGYTGGDTAWSTLQAVEAVSVRPDPGWGELYDKYPSYRFNPDFPFVAEV